MKKISLVIPCYKVKDQILNVLKNLPYEILDKIYIIDDCCPEFSGKLVEKNLINLTKNKIKILYNIKNLGVGGATKKGFQEAIKDNQDIVIKIDGDGQMNPKNINKLLKPIVNEEYDYAKGNRFFHFNSFKEMPKLRIFGNTILSFVAKLSNGYWNIYDPNNGFTAINMKVLKEIDLEKVSNSYFFESDMLFRLSIIRARITDVPMKAIYKDEISNLKIKNVVFEFLGKHSINFVKRIFYNYYLRNFIIASFELPIGLYLLLYGSITGYSKMIYFASLGSGTPPGIMVVKVVLVIVGIQFLLNFLNYEMRSYPKKCINKDL